VLECTPGVVEPLLKVLATAAALSKAAAHGYHHDGDGDHGGHHATDDSSPFTPGSCTGGAETRTPVGAAGGGGEGGGGGMGAPAPPPPWPHRWLRRWLPMPSDNNHRNRPRALKTVKFTEK
jgi:hypothetical protein